MSTYFQRLKIAAIIAIVAMISSCAITPISSENVYWRGDQDDGSPNVGLMFYVRF
ncbi:hypothetical protein L0Y46_02985 [bacterium]|nr:hypothetical protein [bacterium]